MSDLIPLLKDFTPGAYGVWTGVLMLAAWFAKEWRETRKLSAEDRQARREGYAAQLENLQQENRSLYEDQRKLRKEYDDYRHFCQMETDSLREMLIAVQGELAGYKRRVDTLSLVVANGPQNGTGA